MASEQGRAYGVFSAGPKFVKHLSKATQFNFLTEGFQTDCIQTNQGYISTLMSIGVKATTVQLVSTDHLTQLTVSKYRILKTMNLNISSLNNFDTLLCLFLSGFILGHAPFRAFHTSTCSWQPLGMDAALFNSLQNKDAGLGNPPRYRPVIRVNYSLAPVIVRNILIRMAPAYSSIGGGTWIKE